MIESNVIDTNCREDIFCIFRSSPRLYYSTKIAFTEVAIADVTWSVRKSFASCDCMHDVMLLFNCIELLTYSHKHTHTRNAKRIKRVTCSKVEYTNTHTSTCSRHRLQCTLYEHGRKCRRHHRVQCTRLHFMTNYWTVCVRHDNFCHKSHTYTHTHTHMPIVNEAELAVSEIFVCACVTVFLSVCFDEFGTPYNQTEEKSFTWC